MARLPLLDVIHLLLSFALFAFGIATTVLANSGIQRTRRDLYNKGIEIPQDPPRSFTFELLPQNLRRGSANATLAAGITTLVTGVIGLLSAIPLEKLYQLSFRAIATVLGIAAVLASAVALGLSFDKYGSGTFIMGDKYTTGYRTPQKEHFTIEGWACQVKDSLGPYHSNGVGFVGVCNDLRTSKYLTIALLILSILFLGTAIFAFLKAWKRRESPKESETFQMEQQH